MASSFFLTIFHGFKAFINYIDELCKPDPKYIKDKLQWKAYHQRHRVFTIFESVVVLTFILRLINGEGSLSFNMQGFLATLAVIVLLLTIGRKNPELFKTLYNLINITYQILLVFHEDKEVHGGWAAAQVFPGVVYLFTGSIWQFGVNMVVQIILINTIFQDPMRRCAAYMSPEALIESLTGHIQQTLIYVILFTGLTHTMLQNAYHEASEADRKKEESEKQKNFVLGFSHELRNLINSLMGNVKLAGLEALDEKVKDFMLNAEVCAELLLHLVNNILDTGKVEIGELEVNPMPVRIYDTMERIWSITSELVRRKNLRGSIRIQNNIPHTLTLDHYRLTQIFLNLVGNSVKFTDNGKIDVSVEWMENTEVVNDRCFEPIPFNSDNDDEGLFEKKQSMSMLDNNMIRLNLTNKKINQAKLQRPINCEKGVLKITVMDTGIGILKENISKLFQRFTQVSLDPSRRKLGTGLGLFITRQLCQRMGGDVRVYSKYEKGSVFTFCLPIQANAVESEVINIDPRSRQLRALIVDDEQLSRDILKKFLTKLKVEADHVAGDGLSGYHKFLAHATRDDYFNIVTMDLDMPVMDGKMASKKIRALEVQRALTPCFIIVISANCSESEIKECTDRNGEIRANIFLKKPVSIMDLQRVISTYFGINITL